MTKRLMDTSSEKLHFLVFEAHHGVLGHDTPNDPVLMIDAVIARLERAKEAHLAGNRVAASREFDAGYEVKPVEDSPEWEEIHCFVCNAELASPEASCTACGYGASS